MSIASVGCNLTCGNCQNWQISQTVKGDKAILEAGSEMRPEEIVTSALKNNCPSISYTYTEPTIFLEFALDAMKIAKKRGLKNVWVSNGFMTPETLELILPYLDAINVDIKSFDDNFYEKHCSANVETILENCESLKKAGVWIEITTLVIPGLSDSRNNLEKIAGFIFEELGAETPWHISAFYAGASWKMRDVKNTEIEILEEAYAIGKKAGLKFVYSGNLQTDTNENTYCPECGELNIRRSGYDVQASDKKGKCKKCEEDLYIIK
jgi:pyruvate formate lyase activating enzyme